MTSWQHLGRALAPLCLALSACSSGSSAATSGGAGPSCDPAKDDSSCLTFEHAFDPQTVKSGEEISGRCESWTLNNPESIWVNTVRLVNDGAYHHSNWFFVPNTDYTQPDGTWDCNAAGFSELKAALDGGVLFAQSTQSTDEPQKFPEGAAVRIPPYSRIIASTHLLNASSATVTTTLHLTIEAIKKEDVNVALVPFRLTYHDLHIPAHMQAKFESKCDFKTASMTPGKPFSMKLYYVLPHYHKLGTEFSIAKLGGPDDGAALDALQGFNGEANGKTFDPPVDLSMNNGFTFSCSYRNPTADEVGWGIGNQEMCEMLGFADSPLVYDGYVKDGDNVVGATTNGTVMNTGPCTILDVAWDPNKPGGMPPKK